VIGTGTPPPLVNIANALTVARIVLVPVMVAALVASGGDDAGWRIAACVAFCVASITDLYDGMLARSRNLVTKFGQVADPIADKALTGAALVGLSALGLLPWWVTVLMLAREIGVTLLRFWVIRHGVIPASRGGKLKTLLQVVAIAWYLLPLPDPLAALGPWIMGAALVVTLVTGVDYVVRALTLRRTSPRAEAARAARRAAASPPAGPVKGPAVGPAAPVAERERP
jgi:CDP-diacylglycerol--glycerol-3-phosphate 3-phosphatidyltransferase